MEKSNEQVLREAVETALDAFRRMYELIENGADVDDLVEDESLWPLSKLREALEEEPNPASR